ncbi:MAG: energy coupling factor transporter S component ThiW [Oscillibacter sp.]|nr:energy coupling factor transporter S component ThiW [Oscillibacter sp.]
MKSNSVKKLAVSGVLCALAVAGSVFLTFPVLGSRCAPVQHMVNVLCAVFLGPWYGVGVAFTASLLRNLLGVGSVLAFPGSMCGALLCGLLFWKTRSLTAALAGEVLGTSLLGGLAAYPLALAFLGQKAGELAYTAYIIPFLISTAAGSLLAGVLVFALKRSGALRSMGAAL